MSLRAVVFPFDQFGHAGTGAGALLLGDVLREAIDDATLETEPIRPQAYTDALEIVEFDFPTPKEAAAWRTTGRTAARECLQSGELTLWLSGNHLGVLPIYDELGADDLVVQLDAHLDCYDLAGTLDTLSHGNFLRAIKSPRPQIVVIGHRDLFLPADRVTKWVDLAISAAECHADWNSVLGQVRERVTAARRVWLDVDLDALDPAFAPAVQSPQPFGLTPAQLLGVVGAIGIGRLAGISVSEFDPGRDEHDRTLNLLAWWLEYLLLGRVEVAED